MDAFLIPGGFGTRQEMHNGRLHEFISEQPDTTLLTSVCTGSWIYGVMGLPFALSVGISYALWAGLAVALVAFG